MIIVIDEIILTPGHARDKLVFLWLLPNNSAFVARETARDLACETDVEDRARGQVGI